MLALLLQIYFQVLSHQVELKFNQIKKLQLEFKVWLRKFHQLMKIILMAMLSLHLNFTMIQRYLLMHLLVSKSKIQIIHLLAML